MRKSPLLDYRKYRQLGCSGNIFRFSGSIESITDGFTLWVRGEDLTIPVSLANTKCFVLPNDSENGLPRAPEQIRWNRVSTLAEGSKVFIGGQLELKDNRLIFDSTKELPLTVIFYSCPDTKFASSIIRGARTHNEYWNNITPVSLVLGALILVYIAASFVDRPAYRLTVIIALVAIFIPILPVFPPGFLLTVIYGRFTWAARKLRAYWDLAHFGLLPGAPKNLAKHYAIRAYTLEIIAWILMMLGISINIVFIFLVLMLFRVISF
jgi:hypothetical protein